MPGEHMITGPVAPIGADRRDQRVSQFGVPGGDEPSLAVLRQRDFAHVSVQDAARSEPLAGESPVSAPVGEAEAAAEKRLLKDVGAMRAVGDCQLVGAADPL